jgi:hypothetical protein
MADPIANDWKAIHDRMQQIKSEESAALLPCPRCKDRGWMPVYRVSQRPTRSPLAIVAVIRGAWRPRGCSLGL